MLASWVTTVKDLGLPSLVGAVVGAVIAHYTAKARGREDDRRSRDRLLLQDERRAALDMLVSARDIREGMHLGLPLAASVKADKYALHADWTTRITLPARLIRSAELERRVDACSFILFLWTLWPEAFLEWGADKACEDVIRWLEAWLRDEEPPPVQVPSAEAARDIVNNNGRVDADLLARFFQNEWKERNTGG